MTVLRRRDILALLGGSIIGLPLSADAQQRPSVPRIGVLWHAASADEEAIYLGALREGLKDLGYTEGKTIVLENRFPAERPELFNSMAAELVTLNVDVLVAVTRPAALAAQRATKTIPIVFIVVPDPVGSKLVVNLARPGGNVTGLTNIALELSAKRIELLKHAVQGLSHIALLLNANDQVGSRRYFEESQSAAAPLGLTIQPVEV
jgi:putative tryptophan/tyrosine transport system substrate-binding protein